MALNKFMHERNPYKHKKPDFKQLAVKYPEFRKHVMQDLKGNVHLDFKKPENLRALSWAILKEDFDLDVEMPLDRLIPTVPLRLNYILWLEDIIGRGSTDVHGIDIGCGSSCVYPLIGARKNKWKFLASESDETNFEFAMKNTQKNSCKDLITVKKVANNTGLYDLVTEDGGHFDFCMCNPPFFANSMEAWGVINNRTGNRSEPSSVNTASPDESVTAGGEVEFIKKIITDSMVLQKQVRIYSTMIGRKSSLIPLKHELTKNGITNYSVTEFCQGRTMRWGLAWSYDSNVKFYSNKPKKSVKQMAPLEFQIPCKMQSYPDVEYTLSSVSSQVMELLDQLKITFEPEISSSSKVEVLMAAVDNTWSHQRRKRRQQFREEQDSPASKNIKLIPAVCSEENTVPVDDDTKISSQTSVESNSNNEKAGFDGHFPKCSLNENNTLHDKTTGETSASIQNSDTRSGEISTYMSNKQEQGLHKDINELKGCLFKCWLEVRKDADDLLLRMTWVDGENKESFHQVMQFFKNKLK